MALALPSVFTTGPYSTYMKENCRKKTTSTMSSSGTRREDALILNEQNTEAFLARDQFENLKDLKQKVASDLLSGSY